MRKQSDDDIVTEAKKRFERCERWEAHARTLMRDDIKFANGDSDNNHQWPIDVMNARDGQPCLTVNRTRQHNLQVINDSRQNKAGIAVRPVGDGASFEAAQTIEGIVRYIERRSHAQSAYDKANWDQVEGGIGYWRVVTDYANPNSMDLDLDIFVRRVKDPFAIYLDPDIQNYDGSDARYGFVFRDVPKAEFEDAYPEYRDAVPTDPLGSADSWIDQDNIRVAEYFRKVAKRDRLVALIDGSVVPESRLPEGAEIDATRDPREINRDKVEWFLIVGREIVKRKDWPGRYIPIVRCVGEEVIIEGQLDRKGHTRYLKDPQRMYNYWTSAAVEYVALQGKSPWIAPAQAIEGQETYWDTANTVNHSVMPYNQFDDAGRPLNKPERPAPPQMAAAYIEGLKVTSNEMMMVSGQYQAEFGMPSNERSGKAINARQRQGDNATYHFIEHFAQALRLTGEIIIDLIPHVYDTPRILGILAEDGTEGEVHIDPQMQQAMQQVGPDGQPLSPEQIAQLKQAQKLDQIRTVLNPSVGRYAVEADIGPAYATKRQEAFDAFLQIVSQSKELMPIIGDLMFRAADFPMADEISERLRNMIPPQAMGGPSPQMMQMQQQLQHFQGLIAQLTAKLSDQAEDKQRKQYEAETNRMRAAGAIDPAAMKPLIRGQASQVLGQPVVPIMHQHAMAEQAMQPQEPEAVNGA